MNRSVLILAGLFSCMAYHITVLAQPTPSISGRKSSAECVDAMKLARHMYESNAGYLYAPLTLPGSMNSTLALGAMGQDISGGDTLPKASEHFNNETPQPEDVSNPNIHWGKNAENAGRIVVTAAQWGWRGDVYSLYALKGDVTPEQFRQDLKNTDGTHRYKPIIDSEWRPPLVFWSTASHSAWFIGMTDLYETAGSWRVYTPGQTGYKQTCEIRFWPNGGTKAWRLPESVKHLIGLLDQTLGPGNNEGTLQPTARLRLYSLHIWRNVSFRPWALSERETYNTREQVDLGLREWSKNGATYARLYGDIQRTYPKAEADLARYYETQFKIPRSRAKENAHWVLDIAYRSNFVFPGGRPSFMPQDNTSMNPWRGP